MILVPIAVHIPSFEWQLALFQYACTQMNAQIHAVIVRRNEPAERRVETLQWNLPVPHTMVEACFDVNPELLAFEKFHPLNVQYGLQQVLHRFHNDQIIAVCDCDMMVIRPVPDIMVSDNQLVVCDLYEDWHLRSLTENRHVIEPYFENGGRYYNGGFVPIIGQVRTFHRLMHEWIAVHIDILRRGFGELISWWAAMFALQAACEKARVQMIGTNCCYIPPLNSLENEHWIAHYSVDPIVNKKAGKPMAVTGSGPYYDMIKAWAST